MIRIRLSAICYIDQNINLFQTIPKHITPQNRAWVAGEQVSIRTPTGMWTVGIVFNSSGAPRFSAGWNRFSRDNELRKNQMLVFTVEEEHDGIIFDVQYG